MHESERLWSELYRRWGADGNYWHPITAEKAPRVSLRFRRCGFHKEMPLALLWEIFAARGNRQLWKLREGGSAIGPEYEIDLLLFEPYYDGREG